ncbi:hypothetical protein ACWD4L_34780 [Streptomyces sp. NPDC002596]|uniref:hypothetical protein n=1 Tax=Streptomyces sp. NBC_00841 TaxID=2975847 RepID=UPI002DD956E1|nr:hypothetical protein [Streptomyces sp. NBC_00841]WSA04017.1 transposase [Streptomyces sp. NBC_00841]
MKFDGPAAVRRSGRRPRWDWGEGLLTSVDGLGFVVLKRTFNAGTSPKYHHFKRGITG